MTRPLGPLELEDVVLLDTLINAVAAPFVVAWLLARFVYVSVRDWRVGGGG